MALSSTLDIWKKSLISLSDETFLDLATNFIGKVETPFHKPQLIGKLTTLFNSKEFLMRVEGSLSDLDKEILTTVAFLNECSNESIFTIFKNRYNYSTIQQKILNLEERLLLIPSLKKKYLIINPLIESLLIEKHLSLSYLIEKGTPSDKKFNLNIIKALFNLHFHQNIGDLDKSNRYLKSKGDTIFAFDSQTLIYYNTLLFDQEIVVKSGRKVSTSITKMEQLLSHSLDQLKYLTFKANTPKIEEHKSLLFYNLIDYIIKEYGVEKEDLSFLTKLALAKAELAKEDLEHYSLLIESLFIEQNNNNNQGLTKPTIDTDLNIYFSKETEKVGEVDLLHYIAEVVKVDNVINYEITKKALMKAFDANLKVEQIKTYLENLFKPLPQTLTSLLDQWYDQFNSITIYDGIVIKVNERYERVFKALPALQEHLIEQISPSLFLFNRETENVWRTIIASTGFDYLPASIPKESIEVLPKNEVVIKSEIESQIPLLLKDKELYEEQSEVIKEELRKKVLKRSFSKNLEEEMLARVEHSLILIPEQIVETNKRGEISEAGGFDFQGKLNLCRSSVNKENTILELSLLGDDELDVVLVSVKEFIKDGSDYYIRALFIADEVEKVIPVSKIFKIRKLRRSIFL
ncbi:MAG: helicase-associated domain-containing protein [Sphaerochaetaceae bacterium]